MSEEAVTYMTGSPSPDDYLSALAKLETATRFLQSRYIENLIIQAVTVATTRAQSPLCDRAGAAALALCDVSQIDRAAKAGIITAHLRGKTPLFVKAEILDAITSGRWAASVARTGDL